MVYCPLYAATAARFYRMEMSLVGEDLIGVRAGCADRARAVRMRVADLLRLTDFRAVSIVQQCDAPDPTGVASLAGAPPPPHPHQLPLYMATTIHSRPNGARAGRGRVRVGEVEEVVVADILRLGDDRAARRSPDCLPASRGVRWPLWASYRPYK